MNKAIGTSWEEFEKDFFTPEEIEKSNMRVTLISSIIEARKEKGLTQKELGKLAGVKQPVIARMEKCTTSPNLNTVLKLLNILGKTLYVGDLNQENKNI